MRLTDSTVVRVLADPLYIAVYDHATRRPATILTQLADNVFSCGWLVPDGFTEDGDAVIRECNAFAVGFDNGFACANGHDHRNDAEYFDAEEIEAARQGHRSLPLNARSI